MKLAIIGCGVSGLVAAYRLQAEHELTLFEAGAHLGGHAKTVDVTLDGRRQSVDVGFMVFNDATYPEFTRLLAELQVAARSTDMSFSVSDERGDFEYNGHSLGTLFAQRRNLMRPGFYRMLTDIVRFNATAPRLTAHDDEALTVGEFLARQRYSRQFAAHYLLPMGAAIWSCPVDRFAQFPIRFIVEFFRNHGLLNVCRRPTWRVIAGGSRTYVQALDRPPACPDSPANPGLPRASIR